MKLLYCNRCHSVFNLVYEERRCYCGRVSGKYIDNTNAVTNGKGYSLAIGNGSLSIALNTCALSGDKKDRQFYLDECKILCWARPNEGQGNPHTKIEEE